jgi:sialic acid synthase SpsE
MQTMAREFDVPVGYSDHTLGTFVPPIAVAMGATVIEKHLTLDRTMRGPDHAASIEPHEFEAMVQAIRRVELLLGDGVKKPRPAEQEARALVRRGLKAARDITAGTLLTEADLVALRPATGLAPEFLPTLLGRRLNRPLAAGDPIERSALE